MSAKSICALVIVTGAAMAVPGADASEVVRKRTAPTGRHQDEQKTALFGLFGCGRGWGNGCGIGVGVGCGYGGGYGYGGCGPCGYGGGYYGGCCPPRPVCNPCGPGYGYGGYGAPYGMPGYGAPCGYPGYGMPYCQGPAHDRDEEEDFRQPITSVPRYRANRAPVRPALADADSPFFP